MYIVYKLGFQNLRPIGFVEAGRFDTERKARALLKKIREDKPDHADSYMVYVDL